MLLMVHPCMPKKVFTIPFMYPEFKLRCTITSAEFSFCLRRQKPNSNEIKIYYILNFPYEKSLMKKEKMHYVIRLKSDEKNSQIKSSFEYTCKNYYRTFLREKGSL